MKIFIAFFFLINISVSYCQLSSETVTINGVTREYLQYLPVNFDSSTESLPTVIILHGLGGSNSQMASAGFNLIADTARCIVFYPQGLTNLFGQTAWNNGTAASSTADDISLMNHIIDASLTNLNADISKQYVSGFSMGSIMSYHLACNLNDRIAAIGAIAGPMSTVDMNSCTPTYSTPIIHFHGTNDATVPYNSNPLPSLSLVTETLDFWKNQKTCTNTQDSTRITDSASDGLTTDRFVYDGCTADGSLEHWRINGGGHEYYIQPSNDFSHAIEVWLFLRKWSHPNPFTPTSSLMENDIKVELYPNPANDFVTIKIAHQQVVNIQLIAEDGKIVSAQKQIELDVTNLNDGLYFLKIQTDKTMFTKKLVVQH